MTKHETKVYTPGLASLALVLLLTLILVSYCDGMAWVKDAIMGAEIECAAPPPSPWESVGMVLP